MPLPFLTNAEAVATVMQAVEDWEELGYSPDDLPICSLPLEHIAERLNHNSSEHTRQLLRRVMQRRPPQSKAAPKGR